MILKEDNDLNNLTSSLKGVKMGLSLSKFVTLNYSILIEMKNLHVPLKGIVKIIENSINKPVSVASFSVAMSRVKPSEPSKEKNIVIMRTSNKKRFVPKDAVLTLGMQKEIVRDNFNNEKEVLIDWRGLAPGEKMSAWVKEYQDKLIAINLTGWRWKQIAKAISKHLDKEISTNTLTSIICLANKKEINNFK